MFCGRTQDGCLHPGSRLLCSHLPEKFARTVVVPFTEAQSQLETNGLVRVVRQIHHTVSQAFRPPEQRFADPKRVLPNAWILIDKRGGNRLFSQLFKLVQGSQSLYTGSCV